MESERKVKIITLVAVIVAVIGLTIAFAAMSRTLNIHGSGTMDPVNWDIYFENIKLKSDTSPSSVTGSPTPTSGNTAATINNLNVTLKNPGDEVVWTADITNNGDVNAEIQSFSLTPNLTNELLEFTAVYTDEYEHGHVITQGDMLYAGETRNITISFKYKDITDESLLPDEAEEINVSYQIVYVQSNRASTTTEASGSSNNYGEEIASASIGNGITATYYGGTPIAKNTDSNIMQMSYSDNRVADDVRYSGGTLVISGSGSITGGDYSVHLFLADANSLEDVQFGDDGPILKYNPINIVINEGITSIGENSFSYLTSITNVSFASTVTTIGASAFTGCTLLSSVNSLSGLISIGDDAFSDTSLNGNISIPNTVNAVGSHAFSNTNIIKLVFHSGVTSIGEEVCYGCDDLTEVYLPSTITTIGNNAFYNLSNNSVIYCQTQAVANLLSGKYDSSITTVVVDPTKFN